LSQRLPAAPREPGTSRNWLARSAPCGAASGAGRTIEAGCRIRVTDETGAIVTLTGVAVARLHAETGKAA